MCMAVHVQVYTEMWFYDRGVTAHKCGRSQRAKKKANSPVLLVSTDSLFFFFNLNELVVSMFLKINNAKVKLGAPDAFKGF